MTPVLPLLPCQNADERDHEIAFPTVFRLSQQSQQMWIQVALTLQWRTTTLRGSEVSQVSMALQTAQILSRGGA